MLLYLSLVKVVMSCSNTTPEISRERGPDNSRAASFVLTPPPCSLLWRDRLHCPDASILRLRGVHGTATLSPSTSDHSTPDHLIALHRHPHSHSPPLHPQILGVLGHAEWLSLCPPSQGSHMAPPPGLDPWAHSPH